MELTQELLIAALDALTEHSLQQAQESRKAAFSTENPEVRRAFHWQADAHSKRLVEAEELARLIRAHGVKELCIFQ